MRTVKVPLAEREYSIHIAPNLLPKLGERCRRLKLGRRCAVITDENVEPHFASTAEASLKREGFEPIVLTTPGGERAKSLKTVQYCYDQLAEHRLERSSFVVALGGGVIGDLAGFVAATYLRGIPFVQVPTTLLAQVDSSVGGKVGVNLKAGKNLVGAFYQPKSVLCDLTTFETLPEREFRAGLAEVIKYGIIYDARLFRRLERSMPDLIKREETTLSGVIARCCAIKAEVVQQDEREGGLRAILNFGHTVGHAIEAISRYNQFLHGEAISIGQVVAAKLSQWEIGLSSQAVERIRNLFQAAGLPVTLRLNAKQKQRLFEAMQLDKKVQSGIARFVLCHEIGRVSYGHAVPTETIEQALDESQEMTSRHVGQSH